jgi:calcium-dependent protein kinase
LENNDDIKVEKSTTEKLTLKHVDSIKLIDKKDYKYDPSVSDKTEEVSQNNKINFGNISNIGDKSESDESKTETKNVKFTENNQNKNAIISTIQESNKKESNKNTSIEKILQKRKQSQDISKSQQSDGIKFAPTSSKIKIITENDLKQENTENFKEQPINTNIGSEKNNFIKEDQIILLRSLNKESNDNISLENKIAFPLKDSIAIKSSSKNMKFSKETIIKISHESIMNYYNILSDLGHGSYGAVKKVRHKQLGEERAMKIVKKSSSSSQNEIEILKKISHPNIISIYEIFEDSINYYIMTEFLQGGELFEMITVQHTFNEIDAAKVMKQLLNGINFLHNKNICHRDLKPENIMLVNKNDRNYELKIIDFGTATDYQSGKKLTRFIGTSYYISPEVLRESYDEKCDIWSCGVIFYILLTGYPPFNGNSNKEIFQNIKHQKLEYDTEEWKDISQDAIDLVKKMLDRKPEKRLSAEACLNHRWFKVLENQEKTSQKNIRNISLRAIERMSNFVQQNRLKQAVLQFISTQFNLQTEGQKLKQLFMQFDPNERGVITKHDFKLTLVSLFGEIEAERLTEVIFGDIDLDGSGEVSYNEFITSILDEQSLVTNERLAKAFKMFDKDNSGKISVEEIRSIFGGEASKWKKIIQEVDLNSDGEIDFKEFKTMMADLHEKELIQ